MRVSVWAKLLRLLLSIIIASGVIFGSLWLRDVNTTTVALILVLVIVGLASVFGWAEALAAALTAGLSFTYWLLPPRHAFGVSEPQHWVALAAFLLTAIVTGQLSALAKRRAEEAVTRRREMEKLFRFGSMLMEQQSLTAALRNAAEQIVEIFGADGAAVHYSAARMTLHAGPEGALIPDLKLSEAANGGEVLAQPEANLLFLPLRSGDQRFGSIGIKGKISQLLTTAIADRAASGLARMIATEEARRAYAKRKEEQLRASVLDALAHEIKTPLSTIKIAVTTLRSPCSTNGLDRAELLQIIDQEVERLNLWVDEALDAALSDQQNLRPKTGPQDVARLIAETLQECAPILGNRRVEVHGMQALPAAELDAGLVKHVLRQLLDNAVKYSPQETPVIVSSAVDGGSIVISVVDSGIGIPEHERSQVFNHRYRGAKARAVAAGNGLGLPSAKCIMEALGGAIWVTSGPSGGAAFHVSLPLAHGMKA
jgi:two-component system sensor histidine kinase KdpD